MKAIILAAGIGNRLGDLSDNKPKSLLEFEGKSLLKRHLEILIANQIEELTIVTGYQSDMIKEHLEDSALPINYIYNERYTEGSLISLNCAQELLFSEPEFILMDADVLYDQEMIHRLVNTTISNCLLLDRDFVPGDEPVKICVNKDGRMNEFRKKIAPDLDFKIQGESIGFFKFNKLIGTSLLGRINDYLAKGENDTPYEEAIRDLLLTYPEQFGYEDVTGVPWIEIDFPEDIDRAKNEILPKLSPVKN
ncbi:MAG: phosphocholine cytidylyltransferase family protein [Proteobacteria bacterium]|nr:phosphocholine cytidylyltransferase family protein [Pseudomonadota bacterium]NOG61366.1 phosphocholine cytidylyltransferase family protein [Pseudomonadota bacterium]